MGPLTCETCKKFCDLSGVVYCDNCNAARDAELATARAAIEGLRILMEGAMAAAIREAMSCPACQGGRCGRCEPVQEWIDRAHTALAASREPEPAAQGKTSEDMRELARQATESSAKRSAELAAMAPAEREKAIAEWAHKLAEDSCAAGEVDAYATAEPGASSDAEEVASKWLVDQYGAPIEYREPEDVPSLAALLTRDRERVRRETIEECAKAVGALTITRNGKRAPLHVMLELQDRIRALAARGPKGGA